jgi:TPR repeat protein
MGVPRNLHEAAYWFQQAADRGNREAQYNIGLMFVKGEGVPMNKILAFQYWIKAARQSDLNAQRSLDVLCQKSPWACCRQ